MESLGTAHEKNAGCSECKNRRFTAPAFKTYSELIANEQFTPAGFKLRLGLKDIRLAVSAAGKNEVPLPLGSLIHDKMVSGVANGMGDLDWSALALIAARNAGLKKD